MADASGGNFDWPVADLVTGAGFEMAKLDNWYRPGPKPASYIYRGIGAKPIS